MLWIGAFDSVRTRVDIASDVPLDANEIAGTLLSDERLYPPLMRVQRANWLNNDRMSVITMKLLIMLEDDLDRIARFRAIVEKHLPTTQLIIARTVSGFREAFQRLPSPPDLVCLDHDLFTDSPDEPDPGDGRDATNYLIGQPLKAPTLIHSSNVAAASSMEESLHEAGWTVERIAPIGDDWIESYWFPVACPLAQWLAR